MGIEPIAGLLHHGSGPMYTNLLDPAFPKLFARHAQRVAVRYPWLTSFTPINEPLTTARFSCLYGHWYPHRRSMRDFLQALLLQCKAIVLAMRAIRQITPNARLVQTEDLGRVFSTPALSYQAEFENERRWLSFDLLCGRVGRNHPWHDTFMANGADERDLALFLEGDCRPDIVGINHYVTSDRYLDEGVHKYPEHSWGGNARERYADVEAVRVDIRAGDVGMKARLSEAWKRYHLPVAATEVHLGCTREHQLRWLVEAWKAAHQLRASGQDIRAITVWALFGSIDWSSLLVSRQGQYEPGAFDVRGSKPRRTALAGAARALAKDGKFAHPVLDAPGWWQRDDRYYVQRGIKCGELRNRSMPITIFASGDLFLAELLADICTKRGLACSVFQLEDDQPEHQICVNGAWAAINIDARLVRRFGERGYRKACDAALANTKHVAELCARARIPLVHFSSDLVFDGSLGGAYVEQDPVSSEAASYEFVAAERAVLGTCEDALVVRAGPLFGLTLESPGTIKADSRSGITVSPTFAPDVCHAVLDLLIDGERGTWHVANRAALGPSDFGKMMPGLQQAAENSSPASRSNYRSRNFALSSSRGQIMPSLADAIARFAESRHLLEGQEPPVHVAAE
ncbi:MAG: dTDP-4-dehydrorhamnose reductase [Methylobacteriaceae bacterium]|nr:dTDP-4-dehydrorhamnose reductase [Methylobacteriaceae bacterium]